MDNNKKLQTYSKFIIFGFLLLAGQTAQAGFCPKGVPYDADIDNDGYTNPYCHIVKITYSADGSANINIEYIGPRKDDDKCPSVYSIQNTATTCQFDYTGPKMDGIPDGKVDESDAKWIQQRATAADGPTQVKPGSPGDHTGDGLISYHDFCYFILRSGYRSGKLKQSCRVLFPELSGWL